MSHGHHSPRSKSDAYRIELSEASVTRSMSPDQGWRPAQLRALTLALAVAPWAPWAPALAHDIWLTSIEQPQPMAAELQIGLLIGDQAKPAEALAFNPARVERMWLTTAQGAQEIAVTGPQVTLAAADYGTGSRTLAYIGKPAASVLSADKFDDYLREERLDSILQQRQRDADVATAADNSLMVSERYSRSLKLLLSDAEHALIDCPVGLPLELSLVAADDAEIVVKVTFRGQPLAGAWVDRSAADGSTLAEGLTDDDGRVALARGGGDWVVKTTHMVADDESSADWRSWWATTAFRLTSAGVEPCADSSR